MAGFPNNHAELRAAEAEREADKYRSMFENAVEGIFQTTFDGHYITCNPALAKMYKYDSPFELMEHHTNIQSTLYVDPNKRTEFVQIIQKHGRVTDFQAQVRCKDGSIIWIAENAREVRNLTGEFLYYEGFVVDISERKRAEAIVRESELRLRAMVGSIDELVFEFDPDGTILNIWATNDNLLVRPRNEMIGRNIGGLLDRDFIGQFLDSFKRVIQTGQPETFEYALKVLSGERWFVARISPIPLPEGVARTICMSARDITDRKKLEEARARYATILEASPDFVGSADLQGITLYLNRGGRRLVGLSDNADITQTPIDTYHPRWASELIRTTGMPAALRDGSWIGESAILTSDNREIPVSQVILAHKSPSGAALFFSTICRDLTERRMLEEQFRQSQKMEAIGQLAGGVAHDFNNLLTVVMGYSELLLDRLPANSEHRHAAEVIRKTGEHAAALTQQLLSFSRRQVIKLQSVNVSSVASDIQKMLCRLIREDIQLTTSLQPNLGRVWADPGQLEQVIINLVVNARDAMPNGGTIGIETCDLEVKEGTHRPLALGKGKYTVLSVSDTGMGMSRETQARIFEPFFTTKEKGKGTGLGLSTVYGVVKQSEGEIEVISQLNRGTTFKIYLPQISAAADSNHALENVEAPGGDEKVLVVEDNAEVREVACCFLRDGGYSVFEAGDSYTARKICENASIDLLLTDINLPGVNGMELASQLKLANPGIRVLYMSGHLDLDNGPAIGDGGTFVQKPFTQVTLARGVRDALNRPILQQIR